MSGKASFSSHIQDLRLDVSSICVHICEVGSRSGGRACVCVYGFDEFVPVGDCECGEVAAGAIDKDWLFDALIQGQR